MFVRIFRGNMVVYKHVCVSACMLVFSLIADLAFYEYSYKGDLLCEIHCLAA